MLGTKDSGGMISNFCPASNTEDHSTMMKPAGGNSSLADTKANDGMKDVGLLCHLFLHVPYVSLIGVGKGPFINTEIHVNCRQLKGKRKERKNPSQQGSAMTEQDSLKGTLGMLLKTT